MSAVHSADEEDGSDDDGEGEGFDPDQPIEERRKIQRGFRDLQKELTENLEEYMQPGSRGLHETLTRAQQLSDRVKQTTEATIDARLLVTTVDMSYRKTMRLVQGGSSQGLDPDEFVSKCITYMRRGGGIVDDNAPNLSSTQRQRRRPRGGRGDGGDDDDEEDDEVLNWAHLGRFACLPNIRRPALTGFLLGPLSFEKKVRKIGQRTARFRREDLAEVRPEVLDVSKFSKQENDVAAICAKILRRLRDVQSQAQSDLSEYFEEHPNMTEEERIELMHQYGLRDTGGVDLMRFVVNPKSFGQTVENLFYVSFLIRDGNVLIENDDIGMPTLSTTFTWNLMSARPLTFTGFVDAEDDPSTNRRNGEPAKHQAILSMDFATWHDIIDTFKFTECMIEHREEISHQGPGARGWYS